MDLKVKIKLDDTPTFYTLDATEQGLIKSFTLKQELDSDITTLIAPISANELKLTCINANGIFTASNTTSPLYGKLQDGVELQVYDNTTRIGTLYLTDYQSPTSSLTSTTSLRAVDRLQNVLNRPVDIEQIHNDLTMTEYLTLVFQSVGFALEDIVIDTALSEILLNYTVINGKKLSEILADCMIAADSYCYISRTNKVIVKKRAITGVAVKHFTGGNITKIDIPKSMLQQANTLKVGYIATKLSEVGKLLDLKGVKVEQGITNIDNYKTEKDNLFELDNIKILSSSGVYAEEVSCTQSTVSMSLSSTAIEEVDIEVYGKTVEKVESFVKQQDTARVQEVGEKSIEVKSGLIQDKTYADSLLNTLWQRVQEPIPYITISTKVQGFEFDLCYIVDAIEPTRAKIDYLGYIHSLIWTWYGGNALSVEVGIKKAESGV